MKKGRGYAYYCGFRPRDDQSASLGYETRTLFNILNTIGSYPSSGKFEENDNPTYLSRNSDFFVSSFPNGATAIVKHYKSHRENWEGGFSRNQEADEKALKINPMPSSQLDINELKVNGHVVTYQGDMIMAFRTDDEGRLIAFNGKQCTDVTIDGVNYHFSDNPVNLSYVPLDDTLGRYRINVRGEGEITVPVPVGYKKATVKRGKKIIKNRVKDDLLILNIDSEDSSNWLEVVFK